MTRRRRYRLPDERGEACEALALAACAVTVAVMAFVCVRVLLLLASVLSAVMVIVQ
ncbi:MAG: hypothetical protein IKG69_09855 [Atopobiaceae bacterium]|nr:hypothetical protein [Atopobiaceae bacterium]